MHNFVNALVQRLYCQLKIARALHGGVLWMVFFVMWGVVVMLR